ncbi:MAG TPA: hypothetical protein VER96_24315 [Polyangiaceae bacterium]|nr:hypothetical protein [Polyangiaceae bacterium]
MKKNKKSGAGRGATLSVESMQKAKGGTSPLELRKLVSGPSDATVVGSRYLNLGQIRTSIFR